MEDYHTIKIQEAVEPMCDHEDRAALKESLYNSLHLGMCFVVEPGGV